jgi:kinetochore protein Spc25
MSFKSFSTEKNRECSSLAIRASRATAELHACESPLKCRVEGIEKDRLLVRFSHIDKEDQEREFSFVLDAGTLVYRGNLLSSP